MTPSKADHFDPPLTAEEMKQTETQVTIDPASADRDRANAIIIAAGIVGLVAFVTAFFAVTTVARIIQVVILLVAAACTVYRMGLPKPYKTTVRDSISEVERRIDLFAKERLELEARGAHLCDALNDEPFTVPAWATLSEWTWSVGPSRVTREDVEIAAALTATNEHGRTAARTILLREDAGERVPAYPAIFRKSAYKNVCVALFELAADLSIAEPKEAEKVRY